MHAPSHLPLLWKDVVLPRLMRFHARRSPLVLAPVDRARREDVAPLVPLPAVVALIPVRLGAVLGHLVPLHVRRHTRLVNASACDERSDVAKEEMFVS